MGISGGNFLSDANVITELPLTVANSSTTSRSMVDYNKLTYQVDVTNIGTDLVFVVEGSLTNSFVNLDPENDFITVTQNGSYLISFEGKLKNVRLKLVSFTGGTPSLVAHLLRGN